MKLKPVGYLAHGLGPVPQEFDNMQPVRLGQRAYRDLYIPHMEYSYKGININIPLSWEQIFTLAMRTSGRARPPTIFKNLMQKDKTHDECSLAIWQAVCCIGDDFA